MILAHVGWAENHPANLAGPAGLINAGGSERAGVADLLGEGEPPRPDHPLLVVPELGHSVHAPPLHCTEPSARRTSPGANLVSWQVASRVTKRLVEDSEPPLVILRCVRHRCDINDAFI